MVKANASVRLTSLTALLLTTNVLTVSHLQASTIEAINHTHWAINRFSVDGRSGIDIIGAYQGGGGGCCYIVPEHWYPGMTVRVDWETGVWSSAGFPGFADEEKYLAWRDAARAQKRRHSKRVPVPDYSGQEVCGITVHFLPCDEVQLTTSCHAYGSPDYPIKAPLEMPESKSCPK
nr:DUF3304 domain-containing protein [uncultured Pseudomonas sp.]